MSPEAFVQSFGAIPRVSRPPRIRKPAPEVTASCTPEIAGFIDPAGTLQDAGLVIPRHAFGPIVPTLETLYERELKAGKDADSAMCAARARLHELQQTFPDAIEDPVKLARFARAQRLTGPKLAAMMPAWLKTWVRNHAAPEPFVFVPNQPPRFPAWTYR